MVSGERTGCLQLLSTFTECKNCGNILVYFNRFVFYRSCLFELGVEKMAFIKVEDLTYYYPGTEAPALKGINLSLNRGEFVLLVGSSGCGKSSLVRALAGLIPDFYGGKIGGHIYLEGQEIRTITRPALVKKVGMVFQDPESQLIMSNVEQELVLGMENLGLPVSLMKDELWKWGEAFSLSPYRQHSVNELSVV